MQAAGLEGVVASDSSISMVDGQGGRLIYRGYDIRDLAEHCGFEESAYLIWTGELPASAPPMSLLRTCVSIMGLGDPRAESADPAVQLDIAQDMAAQVASIVASVHRIRRGHPPVRPMSNYVGPVDREVVPISERRGG